MKIKIREVKEAEWRKFTTLENGDVFRFAPDGPSCVYIMEDEMYINLGDNSVDSKEPDEEDPLVQVATRVKVTF